MGERKLTRLKSRSYQEHGGPRREKLGAKGENSYAGEGGTWYGVKRLSCPGTGKSGRK